MIKCAKKSLCFTLNVLISFSLAAHSVDNDFLIRCARREESCQFILSEHAPETFSAKFTTSVGSFTVSVITAWAPPMAQRFYTLSRLGYFVGSPFYRVLNLNTSVRFVTQWGYRGNSSVDQAWISNQLNNATWKPKEPGNIRGTVSFGTEYVENDGQDPNCTASMCSRGFGVELFVNLANNSRLDANGFAPFGFISEDDMSVVDSLFSGYGECSDVCIAAGFTNPYCFFDESRGTWRGVNLTDMVQNGFSSTEFPKCNIVSEMQLISTGLSFSAGGCCCCCCCCC